MDQLEHVNCVLCQEDNTEVFFPGEGSARIVRCRNDGLVYRDPRSDARAIRSFQTEFLANANTLWYSRRQETLKREAEAIKKIKSGGALLDLGCATGTFFQNFPSPNWRLYGVDTCPLGAEAARLKYGAEVFCGTLREANFPERFFDVVTVMDALFYSTDPKTELTEIRRILKDDGLLAVEIPGFRAFSWREKGLLCRLLDRKRARQFAALSRLYYFSPRAIRLLLEAAGFRVEKMVPAKSLSLRWLGQACHEIHFLLAWVVLKASAGKLSIAGRELYVARKHHSFYKLHLSGGNDRPAGVEVGTQARR